MDKLDLRLSGDGGGPGGTPPRAATAKTPLMGYCAVGCGLMGVIFGPAIFFTPLALLFSIFALLRGQGGWAFAGLILTIGGVLGSPILMGLIGLGAIYMTFDWHEMLRPLYELINGTTSV